MKYVITNDRGELVEGDMNARDAAIKILSQNGRRFQINTNADGKFQLFVEGVPLPGRTPTFVPARDGKGCYILASTYDMFWHEVATRFTYQDLPLNCMTDHLHNVLMHAASQFRS